MKRKKAIIYSLFKMWRANEATYHTIKEAGDRKFVLAVRAVTHTVTLKPKVYEHLFFPRKRMNNSTSWKSSMQRQFPFRSGVGQ